MSAIISGMCSVARGICSGRSIRSVRHVLIEGADVARREGQQVLPGVLGELDDAVVDVGDVHHLAHAVAEVNAACAAARPSATKVRKLPTWARL